MNLDHALSETEPVSSNPSETVHGRSDEGPLQQTTRHDEPGRQHGLVNLQGVEGQVGDSSDLADTGKEVSRSPLEFPLHPTLPHAPPN